MENVKNCETITKLDAKGIKKALMEFADFDIDERNEIFKIQRTHFHRLKELHKDFSNETLSQCSLVTAVREYIKSIPQEKREIQKFMKKFTKQGKKERMMLERWPRIRKAILEDKLTQLSHVKFIKNISKTRKKQLLCIIVSSLLTSM